MASDTDTGPQPWEGTCPYCDTKSGHLNNHVRQSKGDGHGAAGAYPDDWDTENHERREPASQPAQNRSEEGTTQQADGATEVEGGDQEGDRDDELATISFEGGKTRTYECPDCEETVAYGAEECDEGHGQRWTAA